MIVQTIIESVLGLLTNLFANISMPQLPVGLITAISEICGVGMFVVGRNLFLMCIASFAFWIALKLTLGVGLWAYNLIAQVIP